jgi:ABC-2 type transport system ATP-binding protein
VIETTALHKRYGPRVALHDLHTALDPDQFLGLLGSNGSGKSTLLKLIAGLVRPSGGELRVLGQAPGLATKLEVAYLPELDHFSPHWTATRAYAFHARFYPMNHRRFSDALECLRVPESITFRHLSRGHRTRLRLAVTLAREARVFLFDEPLTGIDPLMRQDILRALAVEFRRPGTCTVLATHQVLEAEMLFGRVLVLHQGRTVLEGDAERLRLQWGDGLIEAMRATVDPHLLVHRPAEVSA